MEGVITKVKTPPAHIVKELMSYVLRLADYVGVPRNILVGIVQKESRFDPISYRYNYNDSRDRSYGLMHLTIETARWIGKDYPSILVKDLYDPIFNIWLGAEYLKYQFNRYKNWTDAISAYNAGRTLKTSTGSYVNQRYINDVLSGAAAMGVA